MARKQDILKRFGSRVRELRLEKGLSQEKFAARCGLDRTYLGSVERGVRNIAILNIEKIAKALGKTLSELMKDLQPDSGFNQPQMSIQFSNRMK